LAKSPFPLHAPLFIVRDRYFTALESLIHFFGQVLFLLPPLLILLRLPLVQINYSRCSFSKLVLFLCNEAEAMKYQSSWVFIAVISIILIAQHIHDLGIQIVAPEDLYSSCQCGCGLWWICYPYWPQQWRALYIKVALSLAQVFFERGGNDVKNWC
jgi:hypothetical protein